MSKNSISSFLDTTDSRFIEWMVGGGVVLLVATFWLWWHFSYISPQNVFWGAIANNLSLSSVSKQTDTTQNATTIKQQDQIILGAQNLVHTQTTITQQISNNQKNFVTTESIGTPDSNFSRYTAVVTDQKTAQGKTFDFKPIMNIWSKQSLNGQTSGSFAQAMYDAVPIANLNASQRAQVMSQIRSDNVYQPDFNAVAKHRVGGILYYDYQVTLTPDKYVALIKLVDSLNGLGQLKNLDPTQYQGSEPIKLEIGVNARAHQISRVEYTGNQRIQHYSAYGAHPNVLIPSNTISAADLQTKFNNIAAGQ